MRRVVLPFDVQLGPQNEQGKASERDRDEERPNKHGRTVGDRAEVRAMTRQLAPLSLIVGAALADVAGRPELAFYLLLAAIPVVVAVALAVYGDLVAGDGGSPVEVVLWGLALVLVTATLALPPLSAATLTAAVLLVGVQCVAVLGAELRRPSGR
jgi:hypothetical protein